MRGVFLDWRSLDRGDLRADALNAALPHWQFHDATAADDVVSRLQQATVAVANKVVLNEAVLACLPHLKLVCVAATGTNNVDIAATRAAGITVCNVVRYATPSVVQHVFALILSLQTRLNELRRAIRQGQWQRADQFCLLDYPVQELAGRTLGIIGYGELGRAVAAVARAFGMKLLVAQRLAGEPGAGRVPLAQLLAESDIVSLHCPYSPETHRLIDATALSRMKSGSMLINTARGGIVDEAALLQSLKSGHLGAAGFDVLSVEPPAAGNPLLDADLPNLIITPHVAWASVQARQRLLDQVAQNIQCWRAGTPQNVVTAV